jgi:Glycosyl transferase family 2
MTAPLISIVTISYNQRVFLRQTIESVLAQKTKDVEYIIVDAGSRDGSLELIAEYGDRIDQVIVGPDQGPADGLNKGFAKASGKIGYFLNSDDFLMPQGLQVVQKFWAQPQTETVLLCGAWMVDQNGLPLSELRPTAHSIQTLLNGSGHMVQQGMSLKLDAFRKISGFNIQNRTCWDLELLCGLMQGGAVAVQSERVGAFRLHGDSFTGGAAGAKHEVQYLADLARLRLEFGVEPLQYSSLRRHLKSPQKLFDRLVPSRMVKRFNADCAQHEA